MCGKLQNAIYRYATFQELDLEDTHQEFPNLLPVAARPEWEADSGLGLPPSAGAWGKEQVFPIKPNGGKSGTRERLLSALDCNLWNVSRTAKQLGLGRATIYRWMKRLGLSRPGGDRPQLQ